MDSPGRAILVQRLFLKLEKKIVKRLLLPMLITVGSIVLAGNVQAGKKAYVCHKGDEGEYKTLKISNNAVDAHLNHGDVLGKCDDLSKERAVIMFTCGADVSGGISVTAFSLSENVPEEAPVVMAGASCAETNASLLNGGFKLENVSAGSGSSGVETQYMYTGEFVVMEPTDPE